MNFKNALLFLVMIQASMSLTAQKKMNLYFKDGSTKTGFVEFKKEEVKFRAKQKGKKEKFDYALLDSAATPINPRAKRKPTPKTVYFLPEGQKGKRISVFELVTKGKLSLYKKTALAGYQGVWINTGGGGAGAGNIFIPGAPSKKITIYALKRKNEPTVTILGGKDTSIAFVKLIDSFKKHSAAYFSDCPSLVMSIKEGKKGFKQGEMKKIVSYYNSNCK